MPRLAMLLLCAVLLVAGDEPAPGEYRKLPCDGSPQLSYDLFIPRAYAERPDERFPVLFISGPGGNPGFMGLNVWAQRQGVVLVTINDSQNGPWAPIHAAQIAVTATVFAKYRLHRLLRFSTGYSGAAWASAELAAKSGDEWGGVLFMINSQRGTKLPKHVCCAYLSGVKDEVYSIGAVRKDAELMRKAGNPVREIEVADRGHDGMPMEDQVALLDWMLDVQRLGHPLLDAAEKKLARERLRERIDALAAADGDARITGADALLQIAAVAKGPDGDELRAMWSDAAVAKADTETDPLRRYRALDAVAQNERVAGMSMAGRKALQTKLAELKKDKAVKADIDSRTALAGAKELESKAGRTKGKLKNAFAAYLAIAKRWPETEAGIEARAAAERLAAAVQ